MRWFYFLLYILPGIPLLSGQNCGDLDLIYHFENWQGDTADFDFYHDEIALNALTAGESVLTCIPDPDMKALFIRFSLDFPPSLANQFQLNLSLGTEGGENRQIRLTVGESGDQDGVVVEVMENDRRISEQKYWRGKYGSGADRSEWVLSPEDGFLFLSDPVFDQTEKISLELEEKAEIYFEKIAIQCRFTQTRRNRFYFHQMQMWSDSFREKRNFTVDEVFLTEIFTGSSSFSSFVELFNSLSIDICLRGLALRIGEEYVEVPTLQLSPYSYLGLSAVQGDLETSLGIPSLSAFLETRREEIFFVELLHHGKVMQQVKIFSAAEQPDHSHEMIDILRSCRLDNWALSKNPGGSPGKENSVFGTLGTPQVHLEWKSPEEVEVLFPYMGVDSLQLLSLVEGVEGVLIRGRTGEESGLILIAGEEKETYYDILIRGAVTYCGGITDRWDTTLQIRFPVLPEEHDVLITEVMYDPPAGCPEYLEIAHRAESVVWTGDLYLQREGGSRVPVTLPRSYDEGDVWVVTADRPRFFECFPEADPGQIIEEKLFVLPNRGARIFLGDGAGDRDLDEIYYEPDLHHSGLGNQKGIALERNYYDPRAGEWRSGYPQYGYRSPGFLPVWIEEESREEEAIVFSSRGIRPGGDSEDNRLEITWNGEDKRRQGFLTVDVFDMNGNKVHQLANSIPVQGGETIFWKGEDSRGNLLKEGLYLFWIYYFDTNGTKRIYKKTCVLSRL